VEKATGPDRELDEGIALLLGWERKMAPGPEYDPSDGTWWRRPNGSWTWWSDAEIPEYTASLDAAASLMPADHVLTIIAWPGHRPRASLTSTVVSSFGTRAISDEAKESEGKAATEPLALTAAALRAHAAQMGDDA
jgi:hypothetical protein